MTQSTLAPGLVLRDPALLEMRCFVNGSFVGEGVDRVNNPANGLVLGHVPRFGAAEATQAVEAAQKAFHPWAAMTAKERSAFLRRWFDLIIDAREDLALILTSEQGKPLSEARGEVDYGAAFVEFYAEEAKRISGETLPSHRADGRILVIKQPVGVVAAITPWNFPIAMITRKVAPALAAGCTVVAKPAPETPLCALALAVLAKRAGFPDGVFNVITGDAVEIGSIFTSHPAIRVVSFTGSTEVGKLLMRQSASTLKRVALELGGNAPVLVFGDADIESAVAGALASKFRNTGQTCVCANRIYVQSNIYDDFVERFTAAVTQLKIGDGTTDGVQLGPLINERAVQKVERHLSDAVDKGGLIIAGGKRHSLGGTFFQATVVINAHPEMAMAREETFGPVAPIFRFDSEREAIAAANATTSGLAAYIFTRDVGRVFRVSEALEYGMVGVNSGLISTELAPFGGVKESGNSREGSHHGIEEFVDKKYVFVAGI